MKVGYLQFCPELNNPEKTMKALDSLITGDIEDLDLLVLPELCNSGYNFADMGAARYSAEEVNHSDFVDFIKNKCAALNCAIVTGFNELENDLLYNSSLLITGDGLQGVYRKLHLFNTEKLWFQPGNLGLPVFKIKQATIGMLICFDWIFPEAWRALAMKGADIICHPANLVLPGFAQQAVPVHGLTNRVYVVTANRIGSESGLAFTGRSVIADPRGKILSEAPEKENMLSIVNIDLELARNKQITERNHLFQDRRPEFYQ